MYLRPFWKPISSDSLPSGQACFSVIFPVCFCFINDYATLQLNNKITFSTLSVEVMDRQLPIHAKAKVDGIHIVKDLSRIDHEPIWDRGADRFEQETAGLLKDKQ